MSELLELAARCEAAEGPDRELDAWIAVALGSWPNTLEAEQSTVSASEWSVVEREPDGTKVDRFSPEPFTASIDAAMTLVPEGMDWAVDCAMGGVTAAVGFWPGAPSHSGATPALALCAAALRSRSNQGDQ